MLNLPMDHIGLHCSDVELNAKWYQEELGFKVAGKFPGMGGRNVYFLENPQDGKMYEISQRDQLPGGATTRIDHIAYRSSETDIRSYQTELRQAVTSGKKDLAASRLKVLVEK